MELQGSLESKHLVFGYLENGWLETKAVQPFHGPGEHFDYTYDPLGRLKAVRNVAGGQNDLLERYTFDPGGNLTEFRQGRGLSNRWEYAPVTRFGKSSGRGTRDATDTHTWDPVTGRMATWDHYDEVGEQYTAQRHFSYDGSGRLVEINDLKAGLTSLSYDVDDVAVYEDRGGYEVLERFGGARRSTLNATQSTLIESVLPQVRVLTDASGAQSLRYTLNDVDGHALFTFDEDGADVSAEFTGAYGVPFTDLGWDSGSPLEIDGLHGSEPDRQNEVMQFGTRHTLWRDGMWMQPEPLLALTPGALIATPRATGATYALANPLVFSDKSGMLPDDIAERRDFANGPPSGQEVAGGVVLGAAAGVGVVAVAGGIMVPDVSDFVVASAIAGRGGVALTRAGTKALGVILSKGDEVAGAIFRAVTGKSGGACFVSGTEVSALGVQTIESVEAGDRVVAFDVEQVLAAASTDGAEEAWVKVESDTGAKSAAWSPRGVCSRMARAGRKAVLPAILAACDPATAAVELPSDVAVVQVYDSRSGAWERETVGDLEVGDEVLHEGHLLRVTDEGVEDRGFAEIGQLSEADATWTVDGVAIVPEGDDWVLVLGDDADAGHWRLQDLTVGKRFAFGGRVFGSGVVDGELAVRATGDVLGRVVNTFVRMAPEVIDAEIAYADGTTDVLTGTPNHPFWVPAVRDYVPLGKLDVGAVLHVQGGGEAILVSKTWRQGEFEVFDFEVEGLHNFYVRGEGSDGAGVLVHNSTPRGASKFGGSIDPTPNGAGGTVWKSEGAIGQSDLGGIVNGGLMKGDDVDILTGVHGMPDGSMVPDRSFFDADMEAFGSIPGVNVHNVPDMTPGQIQGVLEKPGTVIGGFCNSGACLDAVKKGSD